MNSELPPTAPIRSIGKALCVEADRTLQQQSLKPMLEWLGFAVVTAATAVEALEKYASQGPFMLLTTCIYGIGTTGLELGAQIRSQDTDIAMVAYAGFAVHQLPSPPLDAGFDRYLELPFSVEQFQEALCYALTVRGRPDLAISVEQMLQSHKK